MKLRAINMVTRESVLSTQCKVDLPFKRTRRIFNRLDNWCIAISAGTLLWFMGNFSRFVVKASDGATEYIPQRYYYVLFLVLFFISTLIFVSMRGYWYILDFHDMRLRDLFDMDDRRNSQEYPLTPPERDFMNTVTARHLIDTAAGINNEWFVSLRESNIKKIIAGFGGDSVYAKETPAYIGLFLGVFFYFLGLVVSLLYVSWFMLRFYDP